MDRWQLLSLEDVTTGDTYELAFAHSYDPEHCSDESFCRPEHLYIPDEPEGIGCLAPYLDRVFPRFAYYGEQKITLTEWAETERLALAEWAGDRQAENFFAAVRAWLTAGNRGADYFWILGV